MVKQINWSPLAKGELRSLLLSSVQRFGNKEQGKIIYSLFQNALHRITLNPFIGQATEVDNIRYITPCPDYTLFYRHSLRIFAFSFIQPTHSSAPHGKRPARRMSSTIPRTAHGSTAFSHRKTRRGVKTPLIFF